VRLSCKRFERYSCSQDIPVTLLTAKLNLDASSAGPPHVGSYFSPVLAQGLMESGPGALSLSRERVLLFAEFSVATNNTFVKLVAAAYLFKPVDGVTLILLGPTLSDAGITSVRVLSFDRPGSVRNCEGQHEAE